jgi:hypothetical protein
VALLVAVIAGLAKVGITRDCGRCGQFAKPVRVRPAWAESSMAEIDPKLKDLLLREAHLRLSREQLTPVWNEKEAALRAVQTAKPVFLPVFSRRKRGEYETQLAAAQEVVAVLRQGLEVIDRIEPHVQAAIEAEIENILRADRPEYAQALAALRQREEWSGCLDRFAGQIFEFTRSLGNLRNLACSGYSSHAHVYSPNTVQAFALVGQAARKIEEEAECANGISDAQVRVFVANGFNLRSLPRVAQTDYAPWITRISVLPLVDAQVQFDLLIERTKTLYETGIPEMRAQATRIAAQQAAEVRSYLLIVWRQLRAQIAPEIFSGDTERIVTETEKLFLAIPENAGSAPS